MSHHIITTSDGSHSLHIDALDEQYHSIHGALQESRHVFMTMGLQPLLVDAEAVNILEIGLGTGLNALLTFLEVPENIGLHYTSLEAFPLPEHLLKQLNYAQLVGTPKAEEVYTSIHAVPWGEVSKIAAHHHIEKLEMQLQNFNRSNSFDLIYFDAFAPSKQPEMWEKPMLQKMYDALRPGGVFVTYCAKGQVRRDLQSLGFEMERLPGPPGKNHMLRGIKTKPEG